MTAERNQATGRLVRMAALVVAAVFVTNLVAGALFERDTALGIDELIVAIVGVTVGVFVEFTVFRRRHP